MSKKYWTTFFNFMGNFSFHKIKPIGLKAFFKKFGDWDNPDLLFTESIWDSGILFESYSSKCTVWCQFWISDRKSSTMSLSFLTTTLYAWNVKGSSVNDLKLFPPADQDRAHPTFEWGHRPWMKTRSAPSAQSHLDFHHPPMDTVAMTLRQLNQMVLATKPAPLAANLLYKSNRIFLHQLKLL